VSAAHLVAKEKLQAFELEEHDDEQDEEQDEQQERKESSRDLLPLLERSPAQPLERGAESIAQKAVPGVFSAFLSVPTAPR
jgi:uncharacterized membrane protein YkoI